MSFLENLIHGKLTIHQDLINKFLKESLAENNIINNMEISISGGFINLAAEICGRENLSIFIKLMLSLGKFEFNRFNRFAELPVHDPVVISINGFNFKGRLGVDLDPDQAKRTGTPEILFNLLHYLDIKEDKITVDFNKMPGFIKALQNKLGVLPGLLLKYPEIAKLELAEKMIIIHPAVKLL